jgi:peptide/nickel transport system ATP-binding protein
MRENADDLVLDVRGLRISLSSGPTIVSDVDLRIGRGRLLCLVGESGSGKSVTALSAMRLTAPGIEVAAERFRVAGAEILSLPEEAVERMRGDRMAMIFQEPMTSLNPVMRVGEQIVEAIARHRGVSRSEARAAALDMLRIVQIPAPEARMDAYPHQLSGGMRQRVMIAMALSCRPALLIADEPTTALDVTIQKQILTLIDQLRSELGTAVLFITHNLAVVAEIADEIAVMYAGRIVERGPREAIFTDPQHPYTLALFAAIPRSDEVGETLASLPGQAPALSALVQGCRFAQRCPFAQERCRTETPPPRDFGRGHQAACWLAPVERLAS